MARRIPVWAIIGALAVAWGGTLRAADPCLTTDFDPANAKSSCADLALSPRVVRPGETMTATTNVGCNGAYVFCSSAVAAVKLDGADATAVSMAAPMYYGTSIPSVIAGRGIQVGPGHHVVVFTIDRKAKDACVTGVSTDPSFYVPGSGGYRGPFVSVGVGNSWSTPDGFKIDHAGKRGVELRLGAVTPTAGRVWPGETITFSLLAIPSTDADSLTITGDVPAGAQYVDASADQNGAFDGSHVKWTFEADSSANPIKLVAPTTVHFSAKVLDADQIKSLHAITLNGRAEAVIGADTVDAAATRDVAYVKVGLDLQPSQTVSVVKSGIVPADGYSVSKGQVNLADSAGTPFASAEIEIKPNQIVDPRTTGDPRFLVTDAQGYRIFPGRLGGGTLDFHPSKNVTTDSSGNVTFRVLAGTQAGTQMLFEADEKNHASVTADEFLNLTGSPGTLPPGATLFNVLDTQLNDPNAPFVPSGAGGAAQKQETLLEWLNQLRWTAVHVASFEPVIAQVEFAPIYTVGGGHAGIVFYARGSSPNPLLNYMLGGGGAPAGTIVLDVDVFQGAGNHLVVGVPPNLGAWETAVGDKAAPGRLSPTPDEDLMYFGWPYPPPDGILAASLDRGLYSRCVNLPGVTGIVHSPVNLLFTDGQSKSLGIDASGAMKLDLPGVIVRGDGKNPGGYVLPAGGYAVTMTGTASGGATVSIATSGASGAVNTVFTLASAKGATGSVAVDATTGPAQQMTFRGRSYAAKPGLTFLVSGLPKKPFRIGRKPVKVSLVVKDPWKQPVAGALVTVDFPGFSGAPSYVTQVFTDSKGKAAFFPALPPSNYSGTLTVSAPGYVDSVSTVGAY